MTTHRGVLIDTDPGVDDALAMLFAFASDTLDVVALTTVAGNCSLEDSFRNASMVARLGGRSDLPVYRGCAQPLIRRGVPHAAQIHGEDGLLGMLALNGSSLPPETEHAAEAIVRHAKSHGSGLSIVAIAPLTNVALAVAMAPEIVDLIDEVVIMGGAVRVDGNTGPAAEFNFHHDPHAARTVLRAGLDITLMPLDLTRQAFLLAREIDWLKADARGPVGNFVRELLRRYVRPSARMGGQMACTLHDVTAVAYLVAPELFSTTRESLDVALAPHTEQGRTVLTSTSEGAEMRIVCSVDRVALVKLLFEHVWYLDRALH